VQAIGDDIWHHQGAPFRMIGGVYVPSATTVIRLPDGTLAVYSPIGFDDDAAAQLAALGEVAHLIVPSKLHHVFAADAAARWPAAQIHAAPGVRGKQPDLRIDRELGTGEPAAWRGVLDVVAIDGVPKIDEHVVFHHPSRTLVCADLLFNIQAPANLRTRIALAVTGVGGKRLAQSREWRWARRDAAAARAAAERVLAWPIAQVAPCHGEPCAVDAPGLAAHLTRLAGPAPAVNPR
jgi:hypothetical protein